MSWLKSKFTDPSVVCMLFISVAAIIFSTQWGIKDFQGNERAVISSDGLGYYDYLPSIFINDDFSTRTTNNSFILKLNNDQTYNKYFSGTALMTSPFFVGGHISAKLFGYKQNGFSVTYQNSIAIAGLFYLFLGLYFIRKLLQTYKLSRFSIGATLLLLFFGTNLLTYSVIHPSMSHVYSFSLISLWLYLVRKYWSSNSTKSKYIIGMSIVLALIILIRPINGCILFLFPFLSNNYNQWRNEWRLILGSKVTYIAALVCISILFIQPLLWYLQTDQWFIWSYTGEGFNFSKPRILDVLFSFRKGWWTYTPLMLIATIGIVFWYKKNKFLAFGLSSFLLFFIYITSSWWNWYYGSSFGQRPFIDIYGVLALGLAIPFHTFKNFKKFVLWAICIIFTALNLIQTYQYQHQILSPEFMTKEKYNYVFLETDKSFKNIFGGSSDIVPFNSKLKTVFQEEVANIDCTKIEFCGVLKKQITTENSDGLWVEVNVKWETFEEMSNDGVLLVVHLKDGEESISYFTSGLTPIPRDQANTKEDERFTFHFKDYQEKKANLSVYIWNKEEYNFRLDGMEAKAYSIEYQ
jgi:hypothetical protein